MYLFRPHKHMPGPGSVVGENMDIGVKSVGTNKLIKWKHLGLLIALTNFHMLLTNSKIYVFLIVLS